MCVSCDAPSLTKVHCYVVRREKVSKCRDEAKVGDIIQAVAFNRAPSALLQKAR